MLFCNIFKARWKIYLTLFANTSGTFDYQRGYFKDKIERNLKTLAKALFGGKSFSECKKGTLTFPVYRPVTVRHSYWNGRNHRVRVFFWKNQLVWFRIKELVAQLFDCYLGDLNSPYWAGLICDQWYVPDNTFHCFVLKAVTWPNKWFEISMFFFWVGFACRIDMCKLYFAGERHWKLHRSERRPRPHNVVAVWQKYTFWFWGHPLWGKWLASILWEKRSSL